ncbi:hypothetical protein COL940_013957 [Colletotrichum noveboracense]|nr:hypothetical protein COL940_013957 [Colletotrichum noveboracense]
MEVAGLAIGGVSLAAMFTTAVDCFEYIQIGRQFGKGFQTAVLKLDVIRLRLSRWARAITDSDYGVSVESQDEINKVKEVLGHIIYLFEETEKRSKKFNASKENGDARFTDGDQDADVELIHQRMKRLALKRQKRGTFAQKAACALYEEQQFNRLIEDVGDLVKELVEMFPAAMAQQQQLSIEEADDLHGEKSIGALQDANEGEDDLLRESVAQVMATSQLKHKFAENNVRDQVRARYGDEFHGNAYSTGPGSLYEKNEASGDVTVHYGDAYGYGSIFGAAGKRPSGP